MVFLCDWTSGFTRYALSGSLHALIFFILFTLFKLNCVFLFVCFVLFWKKCLGYLWICSFPYGLDGCIRFRPKMEMGPHEVRNIFLHIINNGPHWELSWEVQFLGIYWQRWRQKVILGHSQKNTGREWICLSVAKMAAWAKRSSVGNVWPWFCPGTQLSFRLLGAHKCFGFVCLFSII